MQGPTPRHWNLFVQGQFYSEGIVTLQSGLSGRFLLASLRHMMCSYCYLQSFAVTKSFLKLTFYKVKLVVISIYPSLKYFFSYLPVLI